MRSTDKLKTVQTFPLSPDGSCNNLDNPTQGATGVPFLRLRILDPAFEDGVVLPVGWGGRPKPSARSISPSAHLHQGGDDTFTLMLMQFEQFLDRDLDVAPGSPSVM